MADHKSNNAALVRHDSGVFSTEQTPSTPQPQLGQQHPGASAASASPLSPIEESSRQQLDAETLQHSLEKLSLETNEAACQVQHQCQMQQSTAGSHAMLLRSNSAGSNIGPPRSRPTNLPTNSNLRHNGEPGRTETITPLRNIHWFAQMSDEDLQNHPALQEVVERIVRREVAADGLLDPAPPLAHRNVVNTHMVHQEASVPCGYPQQTVIHHLNTKHLCLGRDGYYHHRRDYYQTEELGVGGFGKVLSCQDIRSQNLFAMKSNCSSDKVESIKRECKVLQDIGSHKNITQFFGAVMDEEFVFNIRAEKPPRVLKMLMELAINGSLSEMLIDPETQDALGLPLDQSLFYLQQVLFGVHYLHESQHVLHLDLKCKNILVFNEGRIVKLADFGTAVKLEEIQAHGQKALVGFTPNFAAPEVIQNKVPTFGADIWSVMCVLVELLTAQQPWCVHQELSQHQLMFKIGNYKDSEVGELVPFEELSLDEDVRELFKSVLKKASSERPTALELLKHHRICEAHEYEKFFDEVYDDDLYQTQATPLTPECSSKETPVDSGTGSMHAERLSSQYTSSSNFSSCAASPGSTEQAEKKTTPQRRLSAPNMSSQLKMKVVPMCPLATNTANYTHLMHSNSAPMELGRRHTVSMSLPLYQDDVETDGRFGKKLKRTSSEHYVSNGPEVDSPEARTAVLSLLRSPSSSCPPPPPHNNSSNNSNGTADVVSQGTQTGSVPSSPLINHCQQEEERRENPVKRRENPLDTETLQRRTWYGPGPNGVQPILHTLI